MRKSPNRENGDFLEVMLVTDLLIKQTLTATM